MKLSLTIVLALTLQYSFGQEKKLNPKNIILMIGDGMGLSQVSSAFYYQETSSNFERFPYTGLIKTSSFAHKITDSAAGATAFSAGVKTYNGAIGVDKDSLSVATIIENVSDKMRTGIIATSSVTHATPASFYAHSDSRKKEEDIASFLHKSPVDFLAGGGLQFFNERTDQVNLLDSLSFYGFEVNTSSLKNENSLNTNSPNIFLLAPDAMPPASERGDYLTEATQKALNYLSQDNTGFF